MQDVETAEQRRQRDIAGLADDIAKARAERGANHLTKIATEHGRARAGMTPEAEAALIFSEWKPATR